MTGADDRWAWIDAGEPEPVPERQLRWEGGRLVRPLPDIAEYMPVDGAEA
jgi:hypothetical protein